MAVLWLHATSPLFRPAPKINLELKQRVQRNLMRWACWTAEGSAVRWTDRPQGAGVRDTDCMIYFVPSYHEGLVVGRTRREPKFASLHYVFLQQLSLGDPAHLGATIADAPAVSEIWASDIIRWIREERAVNPIWSEKELEKVAYALAATALHEAMHNKIESARDPDWDLHEQGGGDMAAPLARRTVERHPPPNVTNRHFLELYFGSRRRQYLHPG